MYKFAYRDRIDDPLGTMRFFVFRLFQHEKSSDDLVPVHRKYLLLREGLLSALHQRCLGDLERSVSAGSVSICKV